MQKKHMAISITEPFASLICLGYLSDKFTSLSQTDYRGELFIHSKSSFGTYFKKLAEKIPFDQSWKDQGFDSPYKLKTGHIIGKVNLISCIPAESIQERNFHWKTNYTKYHYLWQFEYEKLLESPIKANAKSRLYFISDNVCNELIDAKYLDFKKLRM